MPCLITRRTFGLALAGAALRSGTRWALLADTHIAANAADEYRGFRPTENLKRVVPEVLASKPAGALIGGDVARLEGATADYDSARTLVSPLVEHIPLALALGNHDDRGNFLRVFGANQKSGAQVVKGKHVLVVDGGSMRFIVLDSLIQANQTPGLLGKAQRTWLQNYLNEAPSRPTLVFVHHTLDDDDGSLLDAPRLFEVLKPQRSVKAIVYGHSHRYAYDQVDGIHLVNLPAVGYNFADREPVGWVDAVLAAEGGDLTLRTFGGNQQQNGKTTSLAWRA